MMYSYGKKHRLKRRSYTVCMYEDSKRAFLFYKIPDFSLVDAEVYDSNTVLIQTTIFS
jgi:hypothetical protein